MCVALAALDAVVHLVSAEGNRSMPITELYCLPGTTPEVETILRPGELITAVEVPMLPFARRSTYRKVRDRASYAFALVSVAAAIDMSDGVITATRLALGGVAPKPWRAHTAVKALAGVAVTDGARVERAAAIALIDAEPLRDNAFKIELAQRLIVSTVQQLTAGEIRL
jgi:xanthine dehydrogenase YagS FAD-binding subunit